jgi:hypothetical protein
MSITPSIRFSCPSCDQHIECDFAWAGRNLPCPGCGQTLAVPGVPPLPTAADPEPPEPLPPSVLSLSERTVVTGRTNPGSPTTTRRAHPTPEVQQWATFSVAAPITVWILAKLLAGFSAAANVVMGLLLLVMPPVALVYGWRAFRRLRPDRARGWVRALVGICLNSLFILIVLGVLMMVVLRRLK